MGRRPNSKNIKPPKKRGRPSEFSESQSDGPRKQKKIHKAPRVKDTALSDIELQIVNLFGRSYSNGQIGVRYPQQKKKGMMRLMNFCFRMVIDEVAENISPSMRKQGLTNRCNDRKEKTIFHLSSNYRHKHIQQSLLDDFKKLCRSYVKYRSFEHLDTQWLERFYQRVIYNNFTVDQNGPIVPSPPPKRDEPEKPVRKTPTIRGPYKTAKKSVEKEGKKLKSKSKEKKLRAKSKSKEKLKSKSKSKLKSKPQPEKKPERKRGPRGKYKKHKKQPQPQPIVQQQAQQQVALFQDQKNSKANQLIEEQSIQSVSVDVNQDPSKSKICISKVNIYFGTGNRQKKTKFIFPPREQQSDDNSQPQRPYKGVWSLEMEAALIEQYQSSYCKEMNLIIRNLMLKFGRNKLFTEDEIKQKWLNMFEISVRKFVSSFQGKALCHPTIVKEIEATLRQMKVEPQNFFIARFIHDFFFKEIDAISITLLTEYLNKLKGTINSEKPLNGDLGNVQPEHIFNGERPKQMIEREKVKHALNSFLSSYDVSLKL